MCSPVMSSIGSYGALCTQHLIVSLTHAFSFCQSPNSLRCFQCCSYEPKQLKVNLEVWLTYIAPIHYNSVQ